MGLRSMANPQFSIGIDLGTTNCAMAFEKLDAATVQREVFLISQWETSTRFSEASTLPSFLYLLSQDEAAQMSDNGTLGPEWVPGRFARTRAAESPGRVVHSAKSWLCHHGVDRSASFLPWRSDEIPVAELRLQELAVGQQRIGITARNVGNDLPHLLIQHRELVSQ